MNFLTTWDFVFTALYVLIIFLIGRNHQKKKIKNDPVYKYYNAGLMMKIFGGIGVCIIYCFYYNGGDTIAYNEGNIAMVNLLFKSPETFFSILLNNRSPENWSMFDVSTTYPPTYMYRDTLAFSVIRFSSFFSLIGFKSLIPTTVIIAWITYPGIWKLFKLFYGEFPDLKRSFAIAMLFIPSVVFWGSGLLKDAYTLSASAWMIYSFFCLIKKRERLFYHGIVIIISTYVLLSIKPYIFFSLLIGFLFVLTYMSVSKVKSAFLKFIIVPLLILIIWGGGLVLFTIFGDFAGKNYSSFDNMLEKASINQQDLSREYYGENTFDIGKFDPTVGGVLSKFFPALNAGLFRPYIWECSNPVMAISGLENTMLMFFTMYVLFLSILSFARIGLKKMFSTLFNHPLIVFSFFFGFSFAFMVGLTTANFGALVRYKIPLIPFFLTSLFIVVYKFNRDKLDLKQKI